MVELSQLSSLELVPLSLLEESDESQVFFPAAFWAPPLLLLPLSPCFILHILFT